MRRAIAGVLLILSLAACGGGTSIKPPGELRSYDDPTVARPSGVERPGFSFDWSGIHPNIKDRILGLAAQGDCSGLLDAGMNAADTTGRFDLAAYVAYLVIECEEG